MAPKKQTGARIGFEGCGEFSFSPTLQQGNSLELADSAVMNFEGFIGPSVTIPQIDGEGTLTVENYDDLEFGAEGRVVPIQNIRDEIETPWFLDNIGTGSQCCDDAGNVIEYVQPLTGLSVEIPRTTHGITGFPDVMVITPSGAEVGVCVEYIGESVFITSNVPLDNHTAILR